MTTRRPVAGGRSILGPMSESLGPLFRVAGGNAHLGVPGSEVVGRPGLAVKIGT
jgi:hypothetical protein